MQMSSYWGSETAVRKIISLAGTDWTRAGVYRGWAGLDVGLAGPGLGWTVDLILAGPGQDWTWLCWT